MSYVKDPRFAKQPHWVQNELDGLLRKIATLEEQVQQLSGEKPPGSNAVLNPHSQHPVDLPFNATVQFNRPTGRGYLEVRFNGEDLEIHGQGARHDDWFVVRPQVSNAVLISHVPNQD